MGRIHPKHKIAFTLGFLVLLTAFSLNITILYSKFDSFKDLKDLVGEAKGLYNILPDYSVYDSLPKILEEQKASIIDIKQESLNEFYNLKSSGILTEDDFGGFVYANAMKNDVSFDNLDGLSSVPGTFEHFLETKTGDINTLIKNHINYLNGDTSIKDTIFTEWHKYSKRYDVEFLNTIDSHQLELDLKIQPKELGFSSELKAYLNLVNNPKQEQQNPVGAAFKRLLKMITGNVVFGNCVELEQIKKTEDGETYYDAKNDLTKGYYFAGSNEDTITPICSQTYDLEGPIKLVDQGKLFCEEGTIIKATENYNDNAVELKGDTHGDFVISGCTFEGFNTAISGVFTAETSDIEIFHNNFKDNTVGISFANLNANKDEQANEFPTAKIVGNTFENTEQFNGVFIQTFDGEVIVSNNLFSNSMVSVSGIDTTINKDAIPKARITKNYFKSANNVPASSTYLSVINLQEGTIYGNRLENVGSQQGGIVVSSSSDVIISNNLITADSTTDQTTGISFYTVTNSYFLNNNLNGFNKTVVVKNNANNFVLDKNVFKNNKLVLEIEKSNNNIISNNNFEENVGISSAVIPVLTNILLKTTNANNNIFYENRFPENKNNLLLLSGSDNNYLYNVNDNLVYLDSSSAHMYYPLTFDIKRKYTDATNAEKTEPLEMAQINIKEKAAPSTVVAQALSGIVGVPLNQNIYLYSFTKKPNNAKEDKKTYTYSVSYGKKADGTNNELITLPAEITDLTSQQNIAVEFNNDCISPPVYYNVEYKTYNPSDKKYTNSIPLLSIPVNPTNGNNEYTNILINQDTTFCGGLYEIYDGDFDVSDDKKGMIQFADNTPSTTQLKIVCKDTQFKGKVLANGKEGAGIYIKNNKNIEVEGCTFKDYNKGILIDGSQAILINKNKFTSNDVGLQVNQEVAGQNLPSESQAIINLNTFENNKDWNLLFINPASDINNPSYIYNNIFKNTNPAVHPSVKFDLLEEDVDAQVILYKDGYGNYWEDYSNVAGVSCADSYINYKDSYIDADKGNDGFCDKAYQFKANSVAPQYDLLDKYPYAKEINFSNIIPKTSATVSITVDKINNNLVATTINYESFVTGITYNWVVDEESMTVLNLPMNKFDIAGNDMYKLKDISGNNLIAYAGDGTGKNLPELTNEGVGKRMKFNGDEFIKIPSANNLAAKMDNLDEFGVEFIFNIEQDATHPDNILVVRANENEGFLIGTNKKTEDGIEKDNFVFMLFKNVEDNGKKTSIPIKTIESTLNPLQSWHHFVGVFDKTTSKLEFYIDGVKITDDNNADFSGHENLIFNNNDIYFGKFPEKYATENLVTENGFKGVIDELKIYNNALTPEQIQTNYVQLFELGGELKGVIGASGQALKKNIILPSTHGDCGNWKVKSWLTTNEGFLISTDALGAGYNSFLCGLDVCEEDTDCIAPKKCLDSDKMIDNQLVKVCDYTSCTNDADCGAGESCAIDKCLVCTSNLQDDIEITEPTLICAGTYNAVDANNDGYIKIAKDNAFLMCQDGTKIIGPETGYNPTLSKGSTGIFAENKPNVVIVNCNISKFNTGIDISNSKIIAIYNNELKENTIGVYANNVYYSTISNNVAHDNIIGLLINQPTSLYFPNSNITNNQYNFIIGTNNLNSAIFSNSNLSNSNKLIDLAIKDNELEFLNPIINKDIILALQSVNVPTFKIYDTFFDDVYFYIYESLSDADKQTSNANIKRYWTLTTNVVKSTDGMSPVEGASIEMSNNVNSAGAEMVDVNEDNVIDNKDVSFTDKDGMATTLLLANITDKVQTSTTKNLNPYTITAFKQTGLPGATPAVSLPFTIKEPTFKKLDLDTGKEFEIPKVYESTTTQPSTGGGGSSSAKECQPQVDDKCKLKYKYTPCVLQGNISYPTKIFTCNSTNNCGMRLFVEPCEGNAPSYAQGCSNKIKDLFEEGVDCGGPCSKQCAATCTDKKQNQGETDVDCGGSASGSNACVKCLDDRKCSGNEDCKSGFCKNGWCKQSTCYDSFKNQDETNVDCGGKICAPCEGKQEATCYDNIINQGETDVDCGGPCKSCTPILEQPKAFNYYWLLLLLLIPLIAILFYVGYSQYQKQHKPIPPMSKGFGKGNGLKELKGNKGLPSLDDLKLSKELEAELEKPSKFSNKPMPLKKEIFTEFDNVIKDEIKKLLDEGKSKHEINEALKAKGYPHEKVNYLFENSLHDLLPKTYEEQIKKYINYYLSRGMSKIAIKEALLEKGWNKKIVDGVFGKG